MSDIYQHCLRCGQEVREEGPWCMLYAGLRICTGRVLDRRARLNGEVILPCRQHPVAWLEEGDNISCYRCGVTLRVIDG